MWIPKEIIEDHKLDWINKILLTEIISLSKLEKGCIASNETFGKLLNIHRGNVSKRITYLVEEGYIKLLLIKKGEKRTMRVIIPHEGVSDNARRSKRIRTDQYADTHEGVSVNAQRSKRERFTTNTETSSETNSFTSTETSTDTNTEVDMELETDKVLQKLNAK